MSATTAAAEALAREVQQHMSGPLGGTTSTNAPLLAGQPPKSDPTPAATPGRSGG